VVWSQVLGALGNVVLGAPRISYVSSSPRWQKTAMIIRWECLL